MEQEMVLLYEAAFLFFFFSFFSFFFFPFPFFPFFLFFPCLRNIQAARGASAEPAAGPTQPESRSAPRAKTAARGTSREGLRYLPFAQNRRARARSEDPGGLYPTSEAGHQPPATSHWPSAIGAGVMMHPHAGWARLGVSRPDRVTMQQRRPVHVQPVCLVCLVWSSLPLSLAMSACMACGHQPQLAGLPSPMPSRLLFSAIHLVRVVRVVRVSRVSRVSRVVRVIPGIHCCHCHRQPLHAG